MEPSDIYLLHKWHMWKVMLHEYAHMSKGASIFLN